MYICSKRQAYSFPFTKNISHQTFSGLSNYHSNRTMLANLKSLIRPVTDRNSWVIQPRRRHATLLTSLSDIFYKCRATQSYRLNIAPIAFFSTQKPLQIALVGLGIHPQNGQRDDFTHEQPSFDTNIFGLPVIVKSSLTSGFFQTFASTHHSSLMMPAWGASAVENDSKKTLINELTKTCKI